MVRAKYNKYIGQIFIVLVSLFLLVGIASAAVTQYNITNGIYTIVIFNGSGTTTWTPPSGVSSVEYLVVAGGGGGGNQAGGGGGAGGVLNGTTSVSSSVSIIVGDGGAGSSNAAAPGNSGGNSNFSLIQSIGGGGGGSVSSTSGTNGGSGGGVRSNSPAGNWGTGIAGQGYHGGMVETSTDGAGGGGGATGAGYNGTHAVSYTGGNGGSGLQSSITGSNKVYGAGGGGGSNFDNGGGLGGNSTPSTDGGAAATGTTDNGGNAEAGYGGGGGGAGDNYNGGNGASGTVILKYISPDIPGYTIRNGVYLYRQSINITNPSGSVLTGYQLNFNISNETGTSSGKTIYLNSHAKYGFEDIRFTNSSGVILDHWVQDNQTNNANVWVESDSIAISGNTTFYIYYGNQSASSINNGTNTFELFDDFSGSSFDVLKWTTSGTISVTGGYARGTGSFTTNSSTFGMNKSVFARMNSSAYSTNQQPIFGFWSAANPAVMTFGSPATNFQFFVRNSAGQTTTPNVGSSFPTAHQFYIWDIMRGGSTQATLNITGFFNITCSTYIPTDAVKIYSGQQGSAYYSSTDWIAVRNYVNNSPSALGYSTEEGFISPISNFTMNISTGTSPLTVNFTDSSTNTPTSWNWTFGGANFSSGQNPTYTFTGSGNYSIVLNASNSAGFNVSPPQYVNVTGTSSPQSCGDSAYTNWAASTNNSWVKNNSVCTVRMWNSSGISYWVLNNITVVDYLVVSGGGAGGGQSAGNNAGGGAGGILNGTLSVENGSMINVTVGAGGTVSGSAKGGDGVNSSFSNATTRVEAKGGGGGGRYTSPPSGIEDGNTGGSGGGGAQTGGDTSAAGSGIAGQGNNGGSCNNIGAAGGGGASEVGQNCAGAAGGRGGNGTAISITGTSIYYAGGGGGSTHSTGSAVSVGGLGGGGNGHFGATVATAGTNGLGGGGGGGGESTNGGNGGSGTIIMRYLTPLTEYSPPTSNFTMNQSTGTSPLAVNFTDTSTNTPTSWNWTFGGANFSSGQNPTYTFTGAGNYSIVLNASNSAGFNVSPPQYVNVSTLPGAPSSNFTMNQSTGTSPLAVNFTDTSTNTPTSWNWTFGGANFSSGQNPTYTFTGAGNYSVVLNASNSAGFNISPPHYVNVSGYPNCSPYTTTLSGYTILKFNNTASSCSWTPNNITSIDILIIGGGGSGGVGYPGFENAAGGGAGGVLNGTLNITCSTYIISIGTGGAQKNEPQSIGNNGLNSSIYNNSISYISYGGGGGGGRSQYGNPGGSGGGSQNHDGAHASGGSATQTSQSPLTGYGNNGGYHAQGGGGGGATAAGSNTAPSGNATGFTSTISGTSTIYARGGSSALANASGGLNTGNGGSANGDTGFAGGSGVIYIKYISESIAPVSDFTMNQSTGYSPLSVNFTDTSTNSPTSWNWTFGGSNFSSGQNPTYTFTGAGNYSVVLNASNSAGFNSITKYVEVVPVPLPISSFTIDVLNGTPPLTIQFNSTSSNSPTSWNWYFNNVTGNNTNILFSAIENPTHSFDFGNFSIQLNASNSGGYNLSTQNTWINISKSSAEITPVANFTMNVSTGTSPLTVNFTDSSTNTPTSWNWTFGGANFSSGQNPTYTFTGIGNYSVVLNASNGAGFSNITKYVEIGGSAPTSHFLMSVFSSGTAYSEYGTTSTYGGYTIGGGSPIPYPSVNTGDHIVTTKSDFVAHMDGGAQEASSGDTVFIPSGYTFDFTGDDTVIIPAGVTIASDRGYNATAEGAILKKTQPHTIGGWEEAMLAVGGNNVVITGLQTEGEMYDQDSWGTYPDSEDPGNEASFLIGIRNPIDGSPGYTGFEISNCAMRGWAYAAIFSNEVPTVGRTWVHHNYFYHNNNRGEGYGVNVNGGDALVEANKFDNNRHDITGAGWDGEKYEFRYNLMIGNGAPIGGAHVDVHENENYCPPGDGLEIAGNEYLIHHNTVYNTSYGEDQTPFVHVRDVPVTGAYIYNNDIQTYWGPLGSTNNMGVEAVIWQSDGWSDTFGNFFATNNKWAGTVYSNNTGLIWEQDVTLSC